MLHQFDVEHFLQTHWQKSPCLVKGAFVRPPNYISADELAGFALEDDVESRIISNYQDDWQIQHGPFNSETFTSLPESNWTLLVQTMDYWLPELSDLLDYFRFIPRWRYDDVMISFATDGGGVGPHFDNYDVFLIQAEGERRWRVGRKGEINSATTVIDGLLHLENFEPEIDVIMQPGDMLYIPPDTAHWGESIGASIGYSVGYRAPQTRDLLALLAEHFDSAKENRFFTDAYRHTANYQNELEPELIEWAQEQLREIASHPDLIKQLLSESLSHSKIAPPAGPLDNKPEQNSGGQLPLKMTLELQSGVNCNWHLSGENEVVFAIEGEILKFPLQHKLFIETLASGETLEITADSTDSQEFAFYQTLSRIEDRGYFLYSLR